MKSWLISVISVSVLLILLELLLAEGTTKKYIMGIIHLIIVIVIISPIINFFKKDNYDISKELNEFYYIEQNFDNFSQESSGLNIAITEYKIKNKLNSYNLNCDVEIIVDKQIIQSIKIYINENGINEEHTNIYTNEKIIQAIQDIVNIEKDRIIIYENNTN